MFLSWLGGTSDCEEPLGSAGDAGLSGSRIRPAPWIVQRCPPETVIRSPVTQAERSEARKAATSAMSPGLPMRPIGSPAPMDFAAPSSTPMAARPSVAVMPGAIDVDADFASGELAGERLCYGVDRALGGGIDDGVGNGIDARYRAEIDDAATRRAEIGQRFAGREDRAEDVGVELPPEILFGHLLQSGESEDAGIVDEDVEPAEGVLRRLEQALHVRALRDVGLDRDRLAAVLQDRRDDLVRAALARGVVDDDRGAFRRQLLGDLSADAFGGAGDDGDLSAELFHDNLRWMLERRTRALRQPQR